MRTKTHLSACVGHKRGARAQLEIEAHAVQECSHQQMHFASWDTCHISVLCVLCVRREYLFQTFKQGPFVQNGNTQKGQNWGKPMHYCCVYTIHRPHFSTVAVLNPGGQYTMSTTAS